MITLAGQQYAITFVGDCDIKEISGAQHSIDSYGLDQLTRRYRGRVDDLPEFLKAWRRDRTRTDAVYKGLTFHTINFTENGPFADGEIVFKGLHDGTLPPPQEPVTSESIETVTLQQYDGAEADAADAPSVEITYRAPTTTWRYVERVRPTLPRFNGQLRGLQNVVLLKRRGAPGDIVIFPGNALGTPQNQVDSRTLGAFNGVAMTSTSLTVTPAGRYFECEEVSKRTIFPFDLAVVNWVLSV